jgi:predicted nucleotide-binding protein
MMEQLSVSDRVRVLVEQGREFTYDNFSTKGEYGYPTALTSAFVAWRTRVENQLRHYFAENSAPIRVLTSASQVRVLGNGLDKFDHMMGFYLGALEAAADILEDDQFDELGSSAPALNRDPSVSNRVFVVHGHDEAAKASLEVFLTEIGLEPVVLHRKPDEGQTIIEKFEAHSDVGYAFVLLTPDDVAYPASDDAAPEEERRKEFRARPNVIFELGFFVGRLGRPRVCCLYKGSVLLPSDISGILYKKFTNSVEEVAYGIIKELKAVGYKLRV